MARKKAQAGPQYVITSLPETPGPEVARAERGARDPLGEPRDPGWVRGIDRLLSVQRPLVLAHIRSVRRRHPHASPDQLVRVLERRYLTAVTSGGAAVGATAMVPVIGTGTTIALSGVETAGFLEATALFSQSVAEIHGLAVSDPLRARALVMTLIMGRAGTDLLRNFTGELAGAGPARRTHWGQLITSSMPQMVMGPVADQLKSRFVKHFALNQGTSLVGKAVPFGIGAAIGGVGNNVAGRTVVRSAREAFGPAGATLPPELEPLAASAGGPRLTPALAAQRAGGLLREGAGRAGSAGRALARRLPGARPSAPEGDGPEVNIPEGNEPGTKGPGDERPGRAGGTGATASTPAPPRG